MVGILREWAAITMLMVIMGSWCPEVAASDQVDEMMADALGAGETGVANPASSVGSIGSPAVIALGSRYDISGGAGLGPDNARMIHASAADSKSGPIGLGLYVGQMGSQPTSITGELPGWKLPEEDIENSATSTTIGGSLAMGRTAKPPSSAGSYGAAQHWKTRTWAVGAGVVYRSQMTRYGDETTSLNVNVGVAARVLNAFNLSLVGLNLIPQDFDGAPMMVGGGLRLAPDDLWGLEADVHADLDSPKNGVGWISRVGAEVIPGGMVPLRVGFVNDPERDLRLVTTGAGLGNETLMLEYALRVGVDRVSEDELPDERMWHTIGLRLAF